jgi:Flp pilus assembly protein TadD
MSLVLGELARADGMTRNARRKLKKKEVAYHMSALNPLQAEEHRDHIAEELQAKLDLTSELIAVMRYDDALALALDILTMDSMNHQAAHLAGMCHLHMNQLELAIKYLGSAVDKAPHESTYRSYLGMISPPNRPIRKETHTGWRRRGGVHEEE